MAEKTFKLTVRTAQPSQIGPLSDLSAYLREDTTLHSEFDNRVGNSRVPNLIRSKFSVAMRACAADTRRTGVQPCPLYIWLPVWPWRPTCGMATQITMVRSAVSNSESWVRSPARDGWRHLRRVSILSLSCEGTAALVYCECSWADVSLQSHGKSA